MGRGMWLSSFMVGAIADRPVDYPGDANLAIYFANDTDQVYIAERPSSGDDADWKPIGGSQAVVLADATTATIETKNSGRLHIIPELTANCTITLPDAEAGLVYEFIGGGVAAEAQSWVFVTEGNTAFFKGGVTHLDTDAGSEADEIVSVFPDGDSNSKLTVAVPNPGGTRLYFYCDGTNWYVAGQVVGATAPVFADQ